MNNTNKVWKILHSKYLIKRPWLTARLDKLELPDGRIVPEYYVLEYPDWVNVIAITKNGLFVMERQYRHGLQETYYEICGGTIEFEQGATVGICDSCGTKQTLPSTLLF